MNIFNEAAEIMRKQGRGKHGLVNSNGKVCILGAVGLAAQHQGVIKIYDDIYDQNELVKPLSKVIVEQDPYFAQTPEIVNKEFNDIETCHVWNDDWCDDDELAIQMLEKAGVLYDERIL